MSHRRLGLFAAGLAAAVLSAVGFGLVNAPPAGEPGAPGQLAAAPAKPGPDPFGYSAAFDAEVKKLGQITPGQFAAAYPTPTYQAKPSWDYTTAKFFDKINAETVVKEHKDLHATLAKLPYTPAEIANIKRNMNTELPGYKLTPDELAAFKANGFVVSERLGGYSFGQAYYDVYTRDLPDPDLIIRTSGEYRTSNFLLWQSAYAEYYVTDTYWPDFDENELKRALDQFQKRDRRYGGLKTH